jgi:hypothetical protein
MKKSQNDKITENVWICLKINKILFNGIIFPILKYYNCLIFNLICEFNIF